MDARFVRAARYFVVSLLVAQLSVGPAVGETILATVDAAPHANAKTPAPLSASITPALLAPARPVLGKPVRPIVGRPGAGAPVPVPVSPIAGGGLTGVKPRTRPNAQGPGTYAGTASLDFNATSQYVGYSTTAGGTVTAATGYTYALDFGDGSAETTITIGANGATTYSDAHTYATAGTYTAFVAATNPATGVTTRIVTQAIVISPLSGSFDNPTAITNAATTITLSGNVPAMNPPPAPAIVVNFGDATATSAGTYGSSVAFQHTYTATGTYTVTATAQLTGATIATMSVTVTTEQLQGRNGSLSVSPASVYLGAPNTISGTAPNAGPAVTSFIVYGDGTANSANLTAGAAYSLQHTYTAAGTYVVQLTENNAGRNIVVEQSTVNVATPSGTITAPTVAPSAPSTITFAGVVPASNAPAPPTMTIAFGDGSTTTATYGQNVTLTHSYATANTYTVTATLGATTIATGFVVVSASTYTLTANPIAIYSGSSAELAFTAAAGGPRIKTCVLELGDATTQSFPCTSTTVTHTYTATTPTVENIRVSAQGDASNALAVTTLIVDPLAGSFTAPAVTKGSASSITFTGLLQPGNEPAAPTVTINFGDGTPTTTVTYGTAVLAHTYAQSGTFNLTATVGNATIATGTAIVNAAVTNGTIAASPGNVYTGVPVTFSGTAPAYDTGYTFFIAFGDGTNSPNITGGTNYSITHTYTLAGMQTAALSELIQASGQTASLATATVNVAPLSGTFAAPTVMQGTASSITFTATVPNPPPTSQPAVTIAYGDGQTTNINYGNAMLSHTYATYGTYTLTATANGTTIATGTAVVSAAVPNGATIAVNPNSVYVGSPVTITGMAPAANPRAGASTYAVNFGDGTTSANLTPAAAYSLTHTYATAGTQTVTLQAMDANGAITAGPSAMVSVSPLSGTFTAQSVMLGTPSSITFAGVVPANPPANAPQVTIAFGDGLTTTVPYGTSTVQHTYANMGTFNLTATANNLTIAMGTAAVTPAALSLSVAPASTYSGTPTTFTVMYPANAVGRQQCLLTFGDGTSQTFACAPLTVQHTYTVTTNTTETASIALLNSDGRPQTPMTTTVNVVVPAASVSLSSPTIFSGTTENATITTDAISGVAGPTMTLDWGDGSSPTTGLAFQNQVVSHGYATTRSLGTGHRYVAPGTYTIRLYDAAGTLATLSATVVTPTATVAISNANIIPGNTETVTLTVGAIGDLMGPMLTVDYGDGAAQVVTYANATLQHTYTRAGTFTITVSDPTGALATQAVQVFQPAATISLNPSPVLLGAATAVGVTLASLGTATGPAPLTLNYGDGSSSTLPTYANASFNHVYQQIGTYSVTLSAPGFGTIGSNVINVVRQNQALLVPPAPVAANAPADIVVNVTPPAGFNVTPLQLEFGDGTSIVVQSTGTYPHVYAKSGVYTVTLVNTSTGLAIATQQITIEGVTPRVPVGQIYSSSFTNSPVLAGGVTNILIQWSAAVPSLGTILDPIEGYIDLLDAKGKLVRRSDPFEIPGDAYAGAGIHTTQIPYDTPLDAHGTYQTRVILRSTQGGTITVGPPATLIIIGGPDPSIKVNAEFHDTGAVEFGPHAGQPGVTFDPSMSLGFLSPTYSGTVSGIFDPVSRRSDPILTVKSGAQTSISGPDASPAPAPPPPPPPASAAPATVASGTPVTSASGAPAIGASGAPAAAVASAAPVASSPATAAPGTPPNANYMPGPTPVPDATAVASPVAVPAPSGAPAPPAVPGPAGPPDQRAFALPDRAAAYATPSVPVAGPVAATAPPAPASSSNPVPHSYTDLAGRGQATLPDALGGGSTLRGLDIGDTLGPVTYQVGYGYTALATASTSAERGAVGDIQRTVGSDGMVRVTYFGRQDDPLRYPLMAGQTGPLVTDSELLQFSAPTFDGFKIGLSGALSSAHALQVADYRTDDAADKFDLAYTHNSFTTAFNYHNAGPLFAVGSGPGATADRVGGSGALSSPITNFLNLQLNYSTDQARSAFSRQTDAGSTLAFTLPAQSTLSLAIKRDTQVAPQADTRNDSGTAAIGTHIGIGTLALNAGVSSAQDLISSINDAITRTASVQYALQANGHSFGFGINATQVQQRVALPAPMTTATPDPTIGSPTTMTAPGGVGSSMVSPITGPGGNAQFGETMTYGFPFGGRVVNGAIVHGLELQLSASNSNAHAQGSGGYDQALSGILSYHLSAHLALGLRTEENWHGDILEENRKKSSAIRLRLDLTQ